MHSIKLERSQGNCEKNLHRMFSAPIAAAYSRQLEQFIDAFSSHQNNNNQALIPNQLWSWTDYSGSTIRILFCNSIQSEVILFVTFLLTLLRKWSTHFKWVLLVFLSIGATPIYKRISSFQILFFLVFRLIYLTFTFQLFQLYSFMNMLLLAS